MHAGWIGCSRTASRPPQRRAANQRKVLLMKINPAHSLALAAAFAGLLGGTTARLHAQSTEQGSTPSATASAQAGVLVMAQDTNPQTAKHSCKGKNDCKGQGGGKNAGKNSCKGQGDCATDGSKPPSFA